MTTVNTKVYFKQGGDELVVASGGSINIEPGGTITVAGTQGAALTTQLSTITIADAAGTQTMRYKPSLTLMLTGWLQQLK